MKSTSQQKLIVPEENPSLVTTNHENHFDKLYNSRDYNFKEVIKFLMKSVGSVTNIVLMAVFLCI
jgi:hypothetical protein